MGATNDGETESTLLFRLDEGWCGAARSGLCSFGGLALYSAELFCVCKDKVHVLRHTKLAKARTQLDVGSPYRTLAFAQSFVAHRSM